MIHAINLLPVIPMRKDAAHRSEMVSQLLFGEYVQIVEEKEDFSRVISLYDQYEGWVQANQLSRIENHELKEPEGYLVNWQQEVTVNGIITHIPFGCPVYISGNSSLKWGNVVVDYKVKEFWQRETVPFNGQALEKAYTNFLNTPYLWGGKSVFGIDCSGLAQQVFKLFGVSLLRDAYLQATQGTEVASLEGYKEGDLAFFCNEQGRITHVGILLKGGKIVHASGKVRIDPIDPEGITSSDTGKRTHRLHSVRRYF